MNIIKIDDHDFFEALSRVYGFTVADNFANCLSDCAPNQYIDRLNKELNSIGITEFSVVSLKTLSEDFLLYISLKC